MEIGNRIRFYREQAFFSQKKLADLIYVGERTIGHYETGSRIPPIDKLRLIANALEVEIENFVNDTNKQKKDWEKFFFNKSNPLKNMDERRFKMIVQRLYDDEDEPIAKKNITESSYMISILEKYHYDKQLATSLLSLSKEGVVFSKIWQIISSQWEIEGIIGGHRFRILIYEKDDSFYISASHLIDGEKRSVEYKAILETIQKWVSERFPSKKRVDDIVVRLYCDDLTKEEMGQIKLSEISFSHRVANSLKHLSTVRDLFLLRDDELKSIPQLGTTSILEIEQFKEMIISRFVENEWTSFVELYQEKEKKRKLNDKLFDEMIKNLGNKTPRKNLLGKRKTEDEIHLSLKQREENLQLKQKRKRLFE